MHRAAVLVLVISCAVSSAAKAQPAQTPRARTTAAEALGYFAGRWHASSRDPRTGDVLTTTYVVEPTPGGAWFAGAAASPDGAFAARDMWGKDPLTGELIRVIFDGSGTFATVRAAGWAGRKLLLEGEARSAGGAIRVRETITRTTADSFEATWEAYRNGRWEAYALETLTRQD